MSQATATRVETGSVRVDGVEVFFRRIPGEGPPAVLTHGVPTHSEDWMPVLTEMGGPALAYDMPGFGRSERPDPAAFDYSMHGQAAFFERFLDAMSVEDHSLAVHDWGGLALLAEQRAPERVRRLVLTDTVPFLPGYRWHRTARVWRMRGLGELSTRLWTRRAVALALRESRGDWSPHSREFVDLVWDHLDAGTFRAILALYRSAPEDELARLGAGLGSLRAPALVAWGGRDRYIGPSFGPAYAEALPNAALLELPEAGHWTWLDEPSLAARIAVFLEP